MDDIVAAVAETREKWQAEEAADPELKQRREDHVVHVIRTMILDRPPTPPHEIMRWRVRLFCGHIVETIRHVSFEAPNMAGSSYGKCAECQVDHSVMVAWEPIGLVSA
jgi:hypothetical protein